MTVRRLAPTLWPMFKWWSRLTESCYRLAMEASRSPRALWCLAAVSFAESSFFPIPPDVFLIPIVLGDRSKALKSALVCTAASVAGAYFGYFIGWKLRDSVAVPLLEMYGYGDAFARFRDLYNAHGAWIVAGAGFTPFPYKVVTIASGTMGTDLAVFSLASAVSRFGRFALVAWLLWRFGDPVKGFLERRLGWLSAAFFALLIAGFAALKYL